MALGDLAIYAGILGIAAYSCLLVIKHTALAGRISDAERTHTDAFAGLQQRLVKLREKRDEQAPVVDELLAKVIELRAVRDQLQIRYEDMQERSRARDVKIEVSSRGGA